jgi:hypothetical protein
MEDTLGIYEGTPKIQQTSQSGMTDTLGILVSPPFDEKPLNNEVQTVIRQGKKPSLWDRFWKIFEPAQEVQKARAAVIMSLSESTGIAPHKFDPSYKDAMTQGFDSSIIGFLKNQKIPEIQNKEVLEQIPFAKKIAMQASTLAGDMPFMVTGALIGAPGGPETAMGGAFALPMGLRKVLIDRYSKGEIKDSSDFMDRLWGATWETLKGEVIGVTTGMAGKAVAPAMQIPVEAAAMTVVANALEGKIPEAQEFIDTALIIGGLRISTGIAGKLRNIYTETGRRPIEVLHDIEQDPSIKNDIINPDREIPRVYEKLREEEIKAQPIEKDAPKIIEPEKEPEVQIEERTFTTQNEAQKDMIAEGLSEETHQVIHDANDEFRIMSKEPEFFTPSEIKEVKTKPIQKDMLGVVEGTMEGKIPSIETPKTAIEHAMEDAKQRKVDEEMKAKQEVLPEGKVTELYNIKFNTPKTIRDFDISFQKWQKEKYPNMDKNEQNNIFKEAQYTSWDSMGEKTKQFLLDSGIAEKTNEPRIKIIEEKPLTAFAKAAEEYQMVHDEFTKLMHSRGIPTSEIDKRLAQFTSLEDQVNFMKENLFEYRDKGGFFYDKAKGISEHTPKKPKEPEFVTPPVEIGYEVLPGGKAKEPWEMTREELETKYKKAGDIVDSRKVREEIPNMDSIDSSIENAIILPGLYEIPLSEFEGLTGKHYSASGTKRIAELADEISKTKEINPLIVVIDKEGAYILEGATRVEALYKSNAKSFPAKIVLDKGSFYEATKQALSEGKPVPPEVLKDYPELAKEAKVAGIPIEAEKVSLTAFTKEYKESMGEAGFIKTGADKESGVKVVEVPNQDISKLEFPLGTLQVADRHSFLAPIIKANIKAEQNTNHWILRYSDRIKTAFDKVEKPGILMKLFGRSDTNIRDVDLMIEGKKPIPKQYTDFVNEIKGILGDVKTEIIEKMKNDFADSLTDAQKKYLEWKRGGEVGSEPKITVAAFKYTNKKGKEISVGEHEKPIHQATKDAVDEALKEFSNMEKWGLTDYFPHIFKGRFKYLNSETGGIIASGTTAKQAKVNFENFISNNPEMKGKTYVFVNDFYDLLTVRKSLNPNLVNPLEYLGSRLSRKEFFRLIGKTEELIKNELSNAGVDNVKGVKVDMSGIASMQKGTKFGAHFLKRATELRGEETDSFRALMSYIFSTGRKLGLEDAKIASYSFADSLPANMQNTKAYIKMQADNMSGRYNMIDSIFDETIGTKLGLKPFGMTRLIGKGVSVEANLKLGYAPVKTMVNRVGGVFHTILQEGVKNYIEGKKLLMAKDPDLMGRIETEGHLAGMEQLFAGEKLIGISKEQIAIWKPLGSYQKAEIHNRPEALAAAYVSGLKKFNGDKDAAWIYAVDSARLTQGLYNIAAKPIIVRGPILGAAYQFKQYLTNEIRFMSQLTPKQWAGYVAGITAFAGTRGALLTIKSIIGISLVGMGIDNLAEKLNRKAPHLHRGLFGFVGIDVSAPASWQLPKQIKDWMGTFPNDLYSTGEMMIKGLKNNGWTDEDINSYVRQIAPVGYNIFKGLQMLTEGQTKEGSKIIYKGDKTEGVFNFLGAKTVKQSQASDSVRYMNKHRSELVEKIQVVEDKLFSSKTSEDAQDTFNELVELKNIQTSQEMSNLISGLQHSAQMRQLTEEARVFLSLPKSLKREEIERRKP